jgi:hypothetical protein
MQTAKGMTSPHSCPRSNANRSIWSQNTRAVGDALRKNKQYVRALRRLCCVSYSRGRLGQSYVTILLHRASAKLLVCSADTETATAQRPLHKGYRARSMDSSRPSFLARSCSASVPLHSHDKNLGIQTHQ